MQGKQTNVLEVFLCWKISKDGRINGELFKNNRVKNQTHAENEN